MDGAGTSHSEDGDLARLDQLLAEALRLALVRARDGEWERASMRAPLAEACAIARARRLYPEQLIVMLKAAWIRLKDSGQARRDDAQAALDGAVSACIEQYFAEVSRRDEIVAPRGD